MQQSRPELIPLTTRQERELCIREMEYTLAVNAIALAQRCDANRIAVELHQGAVKFIGEMTPEGRVKLLEAVRTKYLSTGASNPNMSTQEES